MIFADYLNESSTEEMTVDEFIEKIKKDGLFGHDIFKNISEEELRKVLEDDAYFSKIKSEVDKKETISEMVIRPGQKTPQEEMKEAPQQNKLSLAVRLGLKKEDPEEKKSSSSPLQSNSASSSQNSSTEQQKETPQSFSDRLKAEYERRKQEQTDKAEAEKQIRDERLKRAEEETKKREEVTFQNTPMSKQAETDDKTEDNINDKNDKALTGSMFKRSRANTVVSDGYKKVTNVSSISDKAKEELLQKEMDKKFPSADKEVDPKKTIGNSSVPIPAKRQTNTEYSKRTLLAVADRMDFDVYCKFRKLNGSIRTGNFRIGKTESQITSKTDTIICQDLDLSKQEKKVVWRTINLNQIIKISPL